MSPIRESITVLGTRDGLEDQRLRDFLTRTAQPFEWLEAESAEAVALLAARGVSPSTYPVLIDPEGVMEGATVERVAQAWNASAGPEHASYDLLIVGAGPAGLAAAVYAASDGLRTLVIERDVPGGQASHTSLIENFFGFPGGIGGAELARLAGRQAEAFGAELVFLRGVTSSVQTPGGAFQVQVAGEALVEGPVVIAAPGMEWRRLEVAGVDELLGRGILYGAGRSEAAQCTGDDVIVVGGGNSAGQAAMDLANAAGKVTLLVRGPRLGKSMSAYLVDRIERHPLIDVRLETAVRTVEERDGRLAAVEVAGPAGIEVLPARAMFLCLGGIPRTGWAASVGVHVDRAGFILTGPDLLESGRRPQGWPLDRDPLALETSVPGLFAAGDVRHGSPKRVAGAVGDGAVAVALVHRRLDELARAG